MIRAWRRRTLGAVLALGASVGCASGCTPEVDVDADYPVRTVTPYAYARSGSGSAGERGPIAIHVFDAPVGCAAFPRSAFAPVPPGVRLEVVVYPNRWEAGATAVPTNPFAGGIYPTSYDANGRAEDLAFSTVRIDFANAKVDAPTFELLDAKTRKGERARARLATRIAFSRDTRTATEKWEDSASPGYARPGAYRTDHVDEVASEFEVELCDDIPSPRSSP